MRSPTLDERFGIPGLLRFEAGKGGLTRAVVTTSAATAEASMLCLETANVADNAVRLEPGRRHEMSARLTVVDGTLKTDASTP